MNEFYVRVPNENYYLRAPWLETALGLKQGNYYGYGKVDTTRLFEGVFVSDGPPFKSPGIIGAVPNLGPLGIYLDGKRLPDPFSQYVVGLHEAYHVTEPYLSFSKEEQAANQFVVDVLGSSLGWDLAHKVCQQMITPGVVPGEGHLIEIVAGMWPHRRQRIVAEMETRYLIQQKRSDIATNAFGVLLESGRMMEADSFYVFIASLKSPDPRLREAVSKTKTSLDDFVHWVRSTFESQWRGNGPNDGPMIWATEIFKDHLIAQSDGLYWQVPYEVIDGALVFAPKPDWTQVRSEKKYVPVGG